MDRPVQKAFRSRKLLCPKQGCQEKLLFFEETGIDHHFRVKHNAEFSGSDYQSSIQARRILHERDQTMLGTNFQILKIQGTVKILISI